MDKEECEAMGGIWVPSHYKEGEYIHSYCREKSKREKEKHVNEHAKVFIRSQKSIGDRNGHFGGPDRYVAVVVAPRNVEIPDSMPLRSDTLKRRGMKMKYFGEGYSKSTGPRSSLGRATEDAEKYAGNINKKARSP